MPKKKKKLGKLITVLLTEIHLLLLMIHFFLSELQQNLESLQNESRTKEETIKNYRREFRVKKDQYHDKREELQKISKDIETKKLDKEQIQASLDEVEQYVNYDFHSVLFRFDLYLLLSFLAGRNKIRRLTRRKRNKKSPNYKTYNKRIIVN